ncbi:hypothetical protein SCHIN_v1c05800 [Spiroplasma chinense]|uniref:ECF transporter S component n=1 Tax=Spiroplasma chinense TaxID=216932 RepID=A0A5B9Y6A6_9MOLU|nr:ECF transporter S component [Spiroplasma chinense]QEH61777.1 hypothetical protein SCHIN_v1c05800 [Spiroplasma chinense]
MKKYFDTKKIAQCAMITALMYIIGLPTIFLGNYFGKSIFQISDIFYLSSMLFINPFVGIISAMLSGALIDLTFGMLFYIPFTVLIKILIGLTLYFLNKVISYYFVIFISYLWIFLYVIVALILFDRATAVAELFVDLTQYFVTTITSCIVVVVIKKSNYL